MSDEEGKKMIKELIKARNIIGLLVSFVIGSLGASTLLYSQSKGIVSSLTADSTRSIVSDSLSELRVEMRGMFETQHKATKDEFSNLLKILQRSNPKIKKVAKEMLKENEDNMTIREALKR